MRTIRGDAIEEDVREEKYEDPALAHENAVGRWAAKIVEIYYNTTRATVERDKKGTDMFLGAKSIQVKGDLKMTETGNFYKETEERTYSYQKLRPSPNDAEVEIHVADGYMIIASRKDMEKTIERLGLKQEMRNENSRAYLIPLAKLPHIMRVHGMTYPNIDADTIKLFRRRSNGKAKKITGD